MIRVAIVTPIRLISDLLQAVFRNQVDFEVTAAVGNRNDALRLASECDVLLVSAELPGSETLEIVQSMSRNGNAPAVVVFGLPEGEQVCLRYLEAGASGCIREQDSTAQLVHAVRLAAARQVALAGDQLMLVIKRVRALSEEYRKPADANPESIEKGLTRREREILNLIAKGYGNREIAQYLTIELGTTKNHVHNILEKLQVKSRRDAAVYFSLGLV